MATNSIGLVLSGVAQAGASSSTMTAPPNAGTRRPLDVKGPPAVKVIDMLHPKQQAAATSSSSSSGSKRSSLNASTTTTGSTTAATDRINAVVKTALQPTTSTSSSSPSTTARSSAKSGPGPTQLTVGSAGGSPPGRIGVTTAATSSSSSSSSSAASAATSTTALAPGSAATTAVDPSKHVKRGSIDASELAPFEKLSIEKLHDEITRLSDLVTERSNAIATLSQHQRLSVTNVTVEKADKEKQEAHKEATTKMKVDAIKASRELNAAKMVLEVKIVQKLSDSFKEYSNKYSLLNDAQQQKNLTTLFFSQIVEIVEQARTLSPVRENVEKKLKHLLGPQLDESIRPYLFKIPSEFQKFKETIAKACDVSSNANSKNESLDSFSTLENCAIEVLADTHFPTNSEQVEFVIFALEREVEEQRMKQTDLLSKLSSFSAIYKSNISIVLYKILINKLIFKLGLEKTFNSNCAKIFTDIQQKTTKLSNQEVQAYVKSLLDELQRIFVLLHKTTVVRYLHERVLKTFNTLLTARFGIDDDQQATIKETIMIIGINQILIPFLARQLQTSSTVVKTNFNEVVSEFEGLVSHLRTDKSKRDTVRVIHNKESLLWSLADLQLAVLGINPLHYIWKVFKDTLVITAVDFVWWVAHESQIKEAFDEMLKQCETEITKGQFKTFIMRCNLVVQIIREWKNKVPEDVTSYFDTLEIQLGRDGYQGSEVSYALIGGIEAIQAAIGERKSSLLKEECVVRCCVLYGTKSTAVLIQALESLKIASMPEMIAILETNQPAIATALGQSQTKQLLANLKVKTTTSSSSSSASSPTAQSSQAPASPSGLSQHMQQLSLGNSSASAGATALATSTASASSAPVTAPGNAKGKK